MANCIKELLGQMGSIGYHFKLHQTAKWNELVKPYREDAIFWKWLHGEVGPPSTGWVAQIMRHTRAQYHYAIKCSRSQNEQIKKFKVMHTPFSSDKDFFKEVMRKAKFQYRRY